MEFYMKIAVGSLLFLALLETVRMVQAGLQEEDSTTRTTAKPVLYVTTANSTHETTSAKPNKQKSINRVNKKEKLASSEATKRNDVLPLRWAFPENFNDQIRQNTNFNYKRPAKTTVTPILSRVNDKSLTDQEYLQNLNVPATYESIVYNPDTKEATSAFSRSNFWETPELVVRDINQREDRGNTLVTTSSRLEYTPGTRQTPLEQIQYRRPFTEPYRKPTSPPVYEKQVEDVKETEDVEEDEGEESENQEVEEDNEEVNEESQENEDAEEERPRHSYPVNLESQQPFNPFENVQEPDDIYSDVLNNIGSVFNDEQSALPPQRQNTRTYNTQNENSLLPQFEQYSFENLQEQERADDENAVEDENEELVEYEDDDEGKESKPVPQQQIKEEVRSVSPLNKIPPPRVKNQERFKESPFPSVKIVNEKPVKPTLKQENSLPFSPWLPTQPPYKHKEQTQPPYKHKEPTPWPHAIQKEQNQKPVYQTSPKVAETKVEKTVKEPQDDSKPYQQTYKKSYNKSWQTSSPKKNENSSYKTAWQSSNPNKENSFDKSKSKKRPRKSTKVLRQSSSNVEEIIRRIDDSPEDNTIFVTPLPTRDHQKDVTIISTETIDKNLGNVAKPS